MSENLTTTPPGPERDNLSPAIDPVCGMTVDPANAAAQHEFRGKKFFFCCNHCQVVFAQNPDAYLSGTKAKDRAPHQVEHANGYVCPMHPEVVSKRPADCRICGMALIPTAGDIEGPSNHLVITRLRLLLSGLFTLPLVALSMANMSSRAKNPDEIWVEFILASPVVLSLAAPFFKKGFVSIRSGNLNMFTLLALGIGIPYALSTTALFMSATHFHSISTTAGGGPYFESAAVIATLAWLGQYLEAKAQIESSGSIAGLLSLSPKIANVINADGSISSIDASELASGAKILVRPGERIAADGEVIEGESSVDESMLTGESVPVIKSPGISVSAGTLNVDGSLKITVDKVGRQTALAQIVEIVSAAQRSKVPAQQLADKVSAIFVPTVLVISILTFVGWIYAGLSSAMALSMALAVLLVACPCALGLATPMAVIVAAGKGASSGVLFKNASALEVLSHVDTLVVDKTGTITQGKPKVISFQSTSDRSEDQLLTLAASLEIHSEHPFAQSIVAEARSRSLPLANNALFKSTPGLGIRGKIDGVDVAVGSAKFLQLDEQEENKTSARPGVSSVFISLDGKKSGVIELQDSLRDSAREAAEALQKRGIRLIVASGDNQSTTETIATECGIKEFHGLLLPAEKEALVKQLQKSGNKVAMLGDGVNDAPALSSADVGIALATGTDIAIDTADIVLIKGDLKAALRAFNLSKQMVKNVGENLFLAFAYNIVAIPLAAGAFLPVFGWTLDPMWAAAAMSVSSVLVIGNSLRLKHVSL